MTAYNIVHMRVKPGFEKQFITHHDSLLDDAAEDLKAAGLHRFSLVKTGDRDFYVLGEWEGFDSIVKARPTMIRSLDGLRSMLEDLGNGLGVTDPASGDVVAEYSMRH
jgi:hypothetical protein